MSDIQVNKIWVHKGWIDGSSHVRSKVEAWLHDVEPVADLSGNIDDRARDFAKKYSQDNMVVFLAKTLVMERLRQIDFELENIVSAVKYNDPSTCGLWYVDHIKKVLGSLENI